MSFKYLLSAGLVLAIASVQAQTTNNQSSQSTQTTQPAQSSSRSSGNQANGQSAQSSSQSGSQQYTQPGQTEQSNQSVHQNNSWNQNSGTRMQNSKAKASSDASRMLMETERARRAIKNNNIQQAKQDVNQALQDVNLLSSDAPNQRMIPLYTELSEYSEIGTPHRNGTNSQYSGQQSNSNQQTNGTYNQQAYGGQNQANPNDPNYFKNNPNYQSDFNQGVNHGNGSNIAVRQAVGEYTFIGLNQQLAKDHLQAAQQALKKGDTKLADQALEGVQGAVIGESVAADMPLLRTRENLMLARQAANHGDYSEAHTALMAASKSLSEYAMNGSHANQAKQIRSEMDMYNQSIQQSHADASSKIESWWNQIAGWNTPPSSGSTTHTPQG